MARRASKDQDKDDLGRWMVSYADFITLMFAFFVVMYAISSVNEGKYRVLADTLDKTFKQQEKSKDPIQVGKEPKTLVQIRKPRNDDEIDPDNPPKPDKKLQDKKQMAKIADQVINSLKPLVDQKLITVDHNQYWVQIEINTSILFDVGSAELENDASEPLVSLARVLKPLPNPIQVEGHTDNQPINTRVFPSNWELSASRAASVVHLFSKNGVEPERMTAIGYGEYRPKESNKTNKGRRNNRRVVIVILGSQNVRRILDIGQKMNKSSKRRTDPP
ncbi:MAG: flagellar motor protein MotD [Gammaproteobacteria bacterium]|nr:flagellar motor protein MotD [Gammaproteobacteria bacterium]MDH5652164.1 flagellar motor protein MotD [Gammaproteobacteria bacterium]